MRQAPTSRSRRLEALAIQLRAPSAQNVHSATVRPTPRDATLWSVDQVISELNLALSKCRIHMATCVNDDETLKHLREAKREIEQALQLLKSIE